jgi:hypothetical protein
VRLNNISVFNFIGFASTAGGWRNWNGTTFASFKKIAVLFFKFQQTETEPKEVTYPVTGDK